MNKYWESLAERSNGLYTSDDFAAACYRLVNEQALYRADRISRVAYGLIENYERDFKQALEPLGVDLRVNRLLRYACAVPTHPKTSTASIEQTLLALVLRMLYDEGARGGQLNDDGEVVCDLVELGERYRLAAQRELPEKGRLDALLRNMKRWGIARTSNDEVDEVLGAATTAATDQPYLVVIRPAIADVLGETAAQRLISWGAANTGSACAGDDSGSGYGADDASPGTANGNENGEGSAT